MPDSRLLAITGGTLILALCVWILRHASWEFPPIISHTDMDDAAKSKQD